jgi:hypothetical protein
MRYLYIIIIASLVYCQGIKPAIADRYFLLYKKGNQSALIQALSWNPTNSIFIIESGDIMRTIYTHNGDLTEYSLYYLLGMSLLQDKNPAGVQAIQRALWLYPAFKEADAIMQQIRKSQEKK